MSGRRSPGTDGRVVSQQNQVRTSALLSTALALSTSLTYFFSSSVEVEFAVSQCSLRLFANRLRKYILDIVR